ncbi:MAG: DUF1028 domain-containing protein [Bacteroidota bacterium]
MLIKLMRVTLILSLIVFHFSLTAQETFSIVAVDPASGQVGSAGATCLTSTDCGGCGGAIIISDLVPGQGAMNAQATVCIPNSNLQNGIQQMKQGQDAQQILDFVLANDVCVFGSTQSRQYGIITYDDNGEITVAGYTGTAALDYKNHRTGPDYAIQGNILLGPQVLDSMEQRFLRAGGSLADRLMAAMQGANIPGADSRCLDEGLSSKSAFLRVARVNDPEDNFAIDLNVPQTVNGRDPIDSLQSLYNTYLLTNTKDIEQLPYQLYPNPATLQVWIEWSASVSGGVVQLFDLNGRLLHEQQIDENRVSLMRPESGPGIYLFKITSSDRLRHAQGQIVFIPTN